MRDEFDPLHDNPRAGWYQRPLRPSRAKVYEMFQELSEVDLRLLVKKILSNDGTISDDGIDEISIVIEKQEKSENKEKTEIVFGTRGITGKAAEEHFIEFHKEKQMPLAGNLIDKRENGCGYDFEIQNADQLAKIEVKGLDGESGGVLFTSKEWSEAMESGEIFYLVIVRNVSKCPTFQIIQDPGNKLNAIQHSFTTIQVNYTISESEIRGK